MPNLECRMYEQRFPEVDAAVMIQVKHIADMGAYVSLLEYNNIEGMILFSELSRRRIRSISSLIKVGRQEPAIVLRVDRDKGYIDLSKRRVSEEEAHACEDRYNKSKLVHSIMRHVAETLEVDLEPLYQRIGWPLYRKYGHAFEAFKLIVADPDAILDALTYEEKEVGPDGQEVNSVSLQNCKSLTLNYLCALCYTLNRTGVSRLILLLFVHVNFSYQDSSINHILLLINLGL